MIFFSVFFFGREPGSSAREKYGKILENCPWSAIFARENFRQFTSVKNKILYVKKTKNYARENQKMPVKISVG